MIGPKGLLQMARKRQKMTVLGRRRISSSKQGDGAGLDACSPSLPCKGTFVVYSQDGGRFVIPLEYINTGVFKELFQVSEEKFGLPRNGPIVMPCDEVFMEHVMSLIPRQASKEEKALLSKVAANRCSISK